MDDENAVDQTQTLRQHGRLHAIEYCGGRNSPNDVLLWPIRPSI